MVVEIHEDQPLVEAVPYVPEGTFGTYNHVWSRDYGVGVEIDGIVVNDIGTVYATDSGAVSSYVRTLGGVENNPVGTTFGLVFFPIFQPVSVTGRYLQAIDWILFTVDVWRDGAMIWSRDPALDNPDFGGPYTVAISPSGEFLAIGAISLATATARWVMLYQGA